jgi:predicted PurR-regulated permease PerM
MAVAVAGASLVITSIQGYLLTPWLTSQVSSLNAVAIFIGLIFWGWLWGPVGLIIATPILMIIKSLCDHVVNLQPVGELLGK